MIMEKELILAEYRILHEHCCQLLTEVIKKIKPDNPIIQELSFYKSNLELHLSFTEIKFESISLYDDLKTYFQRNKKNIKFYTKESFNSNKKLITDDYQLRELFSIHNCLPIFRNVAIQIANNAQKYMYDDTELSVILIRKGNDHVIQFSNIGPTCSEEDINSIFEEGYRGENTHNNIGMGIGLALLNKIVNLHYWLDMQCCASSNQDNTMLINGTKYSEFCIELSYAPIETDCINSPLNYENEMIQEISKMYQIVLIHNAYDIADKLFSISKGIKTVLPASSHRLNLELNKFLAKIKYCQFLYNSNTADLSYLYGNSVRINMHSVFTNTIKNINQIYFPQLRIDIKGWLNYIDSYSCLYSLINQLLFIILSCYNQQDIINITYENNTVKFEKTDSDIEKRIHSKFEELDFYERLLKSMGYNIQYEDKSITIIF